MMIELSELQAVGSDLPPEKTNPAPGFLCLYTAPDGNHCIVGEIFERLGVPVPECAAPDNKVAVGYLALNKAGRWFGMFAPEAVVWASQAQLLGQMGYPWKVCVKSANNAVAHAIADSHVIVGPSDIDFVAPPHPRS
jgi:hypothetical protein